MKYPLLCAAFELSSEIEELQKKMHVIVKQQLFISFISIIIHLSLFMHDLLTVSLVSAPYVMMDTGYSGLVSNVRYNYKLFMANVI